MLISEIFYSVQTEGPLAGTPARFVRVAKCNKQCEFCDTTVPNEIVDMTPKDVCTHLRRLPETKLIVFTGGEPFLYFDSFVEIESLSYDRELMFQWETNGSIVTSETIAFFKKPKYKNVLIISPKDFFDPWYHYGDNAYYKFLVSDEDMVEPDFFAIKIRFKSGHLFFQPIHTGDKNTDRAAAQRAMNLAQKYKGKVSFQPHKFYGLR